MEDAMLVRFTHAEAEFLLLEASQEWDDRIDLIRAWDTDGPYALDLTLTDLLMLDHAVGMACDHLDYRAEKLSDGEPLLSLVFKLWRSVAEEARHARADQSPHPDTDEAGALIAPPEVGPEEDSSAV